MSSALSSTTTSAPATVLQIVTAKDTDINTVSPPSSQRRRDRRSSASLSAHNVPGGALGTWAAKLREVGCPMMTLILLIGLSIGGSVGALVFANEDSVAGCVAQWNEFSEISFSYASWLQIYGLSNLGILLLGGILVVTHGCVNTVCSSLTATYFFMLAIAFKVAWYIVGGILYFGTVTDNCDNGEQIHTFGLVLFILDAAIFSLGYCARRAQDHI